MTVVPRDEDGARDRNVSVIFVGEVLKSLLGIRRDDRSTDSAPPGPSRVDASCCSTGRVEGLDPRTLKRTVTSGVDPGNTDSRIDLTKVVFWVGKRRTGTMRSVSSW